MIDNALSLTQVGAVGGASLGISTAFSLLSNVINHGHEYKMYSLKTASQNFKEEIKDTQDARRQPLQIGRRMIIFSLFYLVPFLTLIAALLHVKFSLPLPVHKSYFFGLYSKTYTAIQTVGGIPVLIQGYMDLMAAISALYFGRSFKNDK